MSFHLALVIRFIFLLVAFAMVGYMNLVLLYCTVLSYGPFGVLVMQETGQCGYDDQPAGLNIG